MRCLTTGLEVNYPCSPVCPLFGDCTAAFNAQQKARAKTNADRIRAMSDEELCEFLMCDPVCDQKMSSGCEDCKKCIMAWLQQPAEEVST